MLKRKRTTGPVTPYKRPRRTGTQGPTTTMTIRPSPLYHQRRPLGSPEKKYYDTTVIDNGSGVAAGVVIPSLIAGIVQGTTDSTRIGGKIRITNINLRGFTSNVDLAAGGLAGFYLRIILFVDKQANGATATVTDILATANFNSFRNMNNLSRFVILKEKFIRCPIEVTTATAAATHTDQNPRLWKINKKVNIDICYSANAGAVTDLRSNNIGILYFPSSTNVVPCSDGRCRIKYFDA